MVLPCAKEGTQVSELAHGVQNVLGRGYISSSVVSFLFTLVVTSAGGTQSSDCYRAVACYVLTMPDLYRTCERELMRYIMAQAFPLTFSPLVLDLGLSLYQSRGVGGSMFMGKVIGLGMC